MKKIFLGTAPVDSGQLMIVDPCYLTRWVEPERDPRDFADDIYEDEHGNKWQYPIHFPHYESPIHFYGGKTANELIAKGVWKKSNDDPKAHIPKDEFSYRNVSRITCDESLYENGHGLLAVPFPSGYGDGAYPVYGYLNEEGRVVKVEIIMDEEEQEL